MDAETAAKRRKLTARQQRIYDLAQTRSNAEIASELGIAGQTVKNTLSRIYRKMGLEKAPGFSSPRAKESREAALSAEYRAPEKVAAAIEVAADPTVGVFRSRREAIDAMNAQMKASGIPGKVSDAIVRRMLVRHADVVTLKKKINTSDILARLDDNVFLIDSYIDDKVCAEAGLRDLAMSKAILLDKRQLLRGEPTAIISDFERKKLQELLPALVAEAKRRAITIEGSAERVIEPLPA